MHEDDGLFETLALFDLDAPTETAFAAMAETRGTKKTFQIATLIAGAGLGAAGQMDLGQGRRQSVRHSTKTSMSMSSWCSAGRRQTA